MVKWRVYIQFVIRLFFVRLLRTHSLTHPHSLSLCAHKVYAIEYIIFFLSRFTSIFVWWWSMRCAFRILYEGWHIWDLQLWHIKYICVRTKRSHQNLIWVYIARVIFYATIFGNTPYQSIDDDNSNNFTHTALGKRIVKIKAVHFDSSTRKNWLCFNVAKIVLH